MSFTERDMQSLWTKWLKKNKWDHCAAFELKITKRKNLNFNRVAEHQAYYLNKGENGGFAYKISDMSPGLKPFDCLHFEGLGYIVIMFYEPRKKKVAYAISIKEWGWYIQQSARKSITEDKAKELAYKVIHLT